MITITTAGFSIHDAKGEFLDWRECVLDANRRMHKLEAAHTVRRVSDGALIATKYRVTGEHFWAALWRLAS